MTNRDTHSNALQSVLAKIAGGAPLAETLMEIAQQIEAQHNALQCAILVWDEDSCALRLAASPSLQQNHCHAIERIALNAGAANQRADDIASSPLWDGLRVLALQYGFEACSVTPVCSPNGASLGLCVVHACKPDWVRDTQRQCIANAVLLASIAIASSQAAARIEKVEKKLNKNDVLLAIEGSGTGIWDRNVLTGEIHYSDGWKAILGYAAIEVSCNIEDSFTRVHPEDLAAVQKTIQDHFDGQTESYAVEHRIRCKDGSYKWVTSRGKVVSRDSDGQALRMTGTTTDITAMKALTHQLQQSVDLITNLTNEVPGLVYQYRLMLNGQAFFPYASEGIWEIYQLRPIQVANSDALVDAILHPDDRDAYHASLRVSADSLIRWHLEYRVLLPGQSLCWRQGAAQPRRLADGSTLWHGSITDITERKRIEAQLHEVAATDFLTGLPNRRNFMQRMDQEWARIERSANAHASVLMLDLDHFKSINDGYGHATGDAVLKHFAGILRSEVRKIDAVGRIGGEEFAVILSSGGLAQARSFAARVQTRLAEIPCIVGSRMIVVTVSIGIAPLNARSTSIDAALSCADMALYRAKECGRNRIETTSSL